MCLIFNRDPAGGRIDWGLLERCFYRNPHGVGVIWDNFGRWASDKSIDWTWAETMDVLKDIDRMSGRQWAVHFRYATIGVRDDRNCHPFPIGDGAFLMHNGTIDHIATPVRDRSDSWHLAREILRGRPLRWAGAQAKPSGSRLLVAWENGEFLRFGQWHQRSAGWFSNDRCFKVSNSRRGALCKIER